MYTYQFTYSHGKVLSIYQLEDSLNIPQLTLENTEGIYHHGKVNADSKEEAINTILSTLC